MYISNIIIEFISRKGRIDEDYFCTYAQYTVGNIYNSKFILNYSRNDKHLNISYYITEEIQFGWPFFFYKN